MPVGAQVSSVSLHTTSKQGLVIPAHGSPLPTQAPSMQLSVAVQNIPSSQPLPFGAFDHVVLATDGSQRWQGWPGRVAPDA